MIAMRRLVVPVLAAGLAMTLAATPAAAQSDDGPAPSGPELGLPEKLDNALREMMDRLKPALDDLSDTFEVFDQIDSLENYRKPEILPNGDIIIRRRDDAPPWQPPEPPAEGEDGIKT